jgi:hypothetical protein
MLGALMDLGTTIADWLARWTLFLQGRLDGGDLPVVPFLLLFGVVVLMMIRGYLQWRRARLDAQLEREARAKEAQKARNSLTASGEHSQNATINWIFLLLIALVALAAVIFNPWEVHP